jgi:hypothetical protein
MFYTSVIPYKIKIIHKELPQVRNFPYYPPESGLIFDPGPATPEHLNRLSHPIRFALVTDVQPGFYTGREQLSPAASDLTK